MASPTLHPIFTAEHHQLRETIRAFARKELAPHALEWDETPWPDWVFPRIGELGLLGLDKPVAYGGQGGDYYCSIILKEEMEQCLSSGLAMAVAVQTDMAMPPILEFGTDEQKQEWAAPAIAGQKILALGITEPGGGSDVAAARTHARRDGGDWIINGSKTYITNGLRSDVIVLVVRTRPGKGHDGLSLFLVPMDLPGVVREKKLDKLGMRASDTALLAFQDVRVPASAVLGEEGRGFHQIMWQLQGERLGGAASALGTAQVAFDLTLDYARDRHAFGRAIGDFQVMRHKFADMSIKLETARQTIYNTAWLFANGHYPVREISIAKVYATEIANHVVDECVQIHGGAGYMREYHVERLWRDVRLSRIGGGTSEIMRDVIAKTLGFTGR